MDVQDYVPPLAKPLDLIVANLAHEGVPVAAIARVMKVSFGVAREMIEYFIEIGTITEMPQNDWPPTGRRADRLPSFIAKIPEKFQLDAIQRALRITRLEANFMLMLLRRDEADKDTLHYVIESQRAVKRSRPDSMDATDPKMVDVVICHLRRKIKIRGIKIKTLWGRGYYLDEENRKVIEEILAAQENKAAD